MDLAQIVLVTTMLEEHLGWDLEERTTRQGEGGVKQEVMELDCNEGGY